MKFNGQFILSAFVMLAAITFSSSVFAQNISDNNLKTNTLPVTNSLSYITQLQPVSYEYDSAKYKQLNLPAGKQLGFITSDVKEVVPSAISNRNNWYNAGKGNQRAVTTTDVDMAKLVPLLVGAVKEQQAEIEKLKIEIQKLKDSK